MSRPVPTTRPLDYLPPVWLPGRDLQTTVPALWPIPPLPGPPEALWVQVAPDTAVQVLIDRPAGSSRGTLLTVHGLGGSADSGYLVATAHHALDRGWTSVRMNLRNCGGTENRARTLYNAAQSDDLGVVLERLGQESFPTPHCLVGFSLGGSLVLRYAGRAGEAIRADACVAVNPPLDLSRCVRELERVRNRPYQEYYLFRLRAMLRRVRQLRDVPGPPASWRRLRTLRRFDDALTAPDAGYGDAEQYWRDASAGPVLRGIRRPTLVLSSANDPFVPRAIFDAFPGSPEVRFAHPAAGGHCGYWQSGSPRYWAASAALDYLDEACDGRTPLEASR